MFEISYCAMSAIINCMKPNFNQSLFLINLVFLPRVKKTKVLSKYLYICVYINTLNIIFLLIMDAAHFFKILLCCVYFPEVFQHFLLSILIVIKEN